MQTTYGALRMTLPPTSHTRIRSNDDDDDIALEANDHSYSSNADISERNEESGLFRTNDESFHSSSHSVSFFWKTLVLFTLACVLVISLGSTVRMRRANHSPVATTPCPRSDIESLSSFEVSGLSHAAVATDHSVCSQVGLDILQKHQGNAVDAAVAVALCLGVANPASSGMGGGTFLLVHGKLREDAHAYTQYDDHTTRNATTHYQSDGRIFEVIDAREVAPGAASTDMFTAYDKSSVVGGLAAAVPGELRGLELAHARFGALSWQQVVQPAYELARDGIVINTNLAHEIAYSAGMIAKHSLPDFGLKKLLTKNNDWKQPLVEGDILRNAALAQTLKHVMEQGADALYTGERAEKIAADVQKAGGILTAEDLASYRPVLRDPLVAENIAGYTLVGVPPPSSGGPAIIGAIRYLAGYLEPLSANADTLTVHRLSEAVKHVFAMRMSLSDPAYNTEVVQDAVEDMVQSPYMEHLRRSSLDNSTLPLSQYGGRKWAQLNDTDGANAAEDKKEGDRRRRRHLLRHFGYLNDHGTSHFSIVDKDGNAVAMTTSVNTIFGSQVLSEGIVLGNTMDDFAQPGSPNFYGLKPSPSNYIMPGKKPLSSMSPTMVVDADRDKLLMVVGASGGPKIITAVLQVIFNTLWLGWPLLEAVSRPRIHDQLIYHGSAITATERSKLPNGVSFVVPDRTKYALQQRNHQLLDVDYAGTVQTVFRDFELNQWSAVSDPRKGGAPAGY
jgi:gamma-glutamyltranspeptidase